MRKMKDVILTPNFQIATSTQTWNTVKFTKMYINSQKKKLLNYWRNLITNNQIWHKTNGSNLGICQKTAI